MESMRKDPDKYSSIIYYASVSSITNKGGIFYNAPYAVGQQLQYPSFDSFFEAYKAMLLDDAEKLYKHLVKEWVNRIITDYVSNQGILISLQRGNHDKMKYYAEGIQKFQRQLRLAVSNFPDILKEETQNDLDSLTKLNEGGGSTATNEL